jgi:hypothetical protein
MKDLLAEPPPDAFPRLVRINVKGIEDHDEARRPTILRLRLRCVLLGKRKVVLHGPCEHALSEELLA